MSPTSSSLSTYRLIMFICIKISKRSYIGITFQLTHLCIDICCVFYLKEKEKQQQLKASGCTLFGGQEFTWIIYNDRIMLLFSISPKKTYNSGFKQTRKICVIVRYQGVLLKKDNDKTVASFLFHMFNNKKIVCPYPRPTLG